MAPLCGRAGPLNIPKWRFPAPAVAMKNLDPAEGDDLGRFRTHGASGVERGGQKNYGESPDCACCVATPPAAARQRVN